MSEPGGIFVGFPLTTTHIFPPPNTNECPRPQQHNHYTIIITSTNKALSPTCPLTQPFYFEVQIFHFHIYSSPWNGGICSICYEVQSQKCRDWSDNFWQMNQYPWPNLRIYIAGFCKLWKWIYPLLYPIINNCTGWQALPMDCIGLGGNKNHYENITDLLLLLSWKQLYMQFSMMFGHSSIWVVC